MRILSINVAQPRELTLKGKVVATSIYKVPVSGACRIEHKGLAGDFRVEPRRLGDLDHAVYALSHEYYAYFAPQLGAETLPMGYFGENLTLEGFDDTQARIGDVLRVGGAILQITHPRIPCRKLDARVGMRFSSLFLRSRRVGFYLRVLQPGSVSAGDNLELLDTDPESPTVDEFVRVSQFDYWDIAGLQHLLRAKDLMESWRDLIQDKLDRAQQASGWAGTRALKVIARDVESDTTVSFRLQCEQGRPLPAFKGGQALNVVFRPDDEGRALRGALALSSDPADPSSYRITIEHNSNATSAGSELENTLSNDLQVGSVLRASAPNGPFTLDAAPGACDIISCVTSGIALAPVLSLLHDWVFRHDWRPLQVILVDRPRMPPRLLGEVFDLVARHSLLSVVDADPLMAPGSDNVEPLVQLVSSKMPFVFLTGPAAFVDSLGKALLARGVHPRHMRNRLGALTR